MSATTTNRPVTFDHLAKKKKRQEKILYVPLNEQAQAELDEAEQEMQTARLIASATRIAQAEDRLATARAELQKPENSIRFLLRSMGRNEFRSLISDHPPVQVDIEAAKASNQPTPEFDPESLAPYLVAATVVEPAMSVEQARSLTVSEGSKSEDGLPGLGWNDAEWEALVNSCMVVNTQSRISDYSF